MNPPRLADPFHTINELAGGRQRRGRDASVHKGTVYADGGAAVTHRREDHDPCHGEGAPRVL